MYFLCVNMLIIDMVQDAVLLQSANWETGTFDEGGEHCEVCCECQLSFTILNMLENAN